MPLWSDIGDGRCRDCCLYARLISSVALGLTTGPFAAPRFL